MDAAPARTWRCEGEALLRLRLMRPKANILDARMIAALDAALTAGLASGPTLAVLIDAEGPHLSFGASVEEHLPEHCAAMLRGFHALLLRLLALPVPVLCAVRGQCLGGGLELALTASRIFAAPGAMFGQPEIRLGVFAPAASALLPERIGRPAAEDMLLSGRSLGAEEAQAIGLIQTVAEDPARVAEEWFSAHLADKSAAALAHAMVASRADLIARTRARLAELESLYLDDLMRTQDALTGLQAFLAKRTPHWEHR